MKNDKSLNIELCLQRYKDGSCIVLAIHKTYDGSNVATVSMTKKDLIEAITEAMRDVIKMAPNLTQEEIDNYYVEHYPTGWSDNRG
jgi:phenylpyruvate tautomerase PptA (4-oxalocrotonate tautomerase family)